MNTELKQLSDDYLRIEQAILYLENHYKDQPGIEELAASLGLSESHFQRTLHPLGRSQPEALPAIPDEGTAQRNCSTAPKTCWTPRIKIGLSSLGRLHELFVTTEAVTPGEYKSRGAGVDHPLRDSSTRPSASA
ncbi:MAG: hypothetical protein M0C28_29685 [Candidatus Moduliflexus flocculans]|nr:hypothetical protein [Candidatus Moduliflexus flocculans]